MPPTPEIIYSPVATRRVKKEIPVDGLSAPVGKMEKQSGDKKRKNDRKREIGRAGEGCHHLSIRVFYGTC